MSASLILRNFYSGSCTGANIQARRITSEWNGNTMTWANKPGGGTAYMDTYKPAHGYNSSCSAGDATWDVTGMVQEWVDGSFANNGILLRAEDETSIYSWRRYRSANYTTSPAFQPKIKVTYNRAPNKATLPTPNALSTFTPLGSSTERLYTSWLRPTFTAKATDPDGNNVKITYEVRAGSSGGSTLLSSCTTGLVASGTDATCRIPDYLSDGGTYYVRAQSQDQRGVTAAWSGWTEFSVAQAAPDAPTISCPGYTDGSWDATPPSTDVTCTITLTGDGATAPAYVTTTRNTTTLQDAVKITQPTSLSDYTHQITIPHTAGAYLVTVDAISPTGQTTETTLGFGYGAFSLSTPVPATAGKPALTTANTVNIRASGPVDTASNPTASLQWRVASSGLDDSTGWNDLGSSGVTVTNDGVNPAVVTTTLDTSTLTYDTAQGITLDARQPVLIDIQICLDYTGATACTWATTPSTVLRVPHAFGDGFPTSDAGPGQVGLFTGEFAASATDATVPDGNDVLSVSRNHYTFDGTPANPAAAVFGPGWAAQLDGPQAGLAGLWPVDSTLIDGTIDLIAPDGSALVFALPGGPTRRDASATELTTSASGHDQTLIPVDDDTTLSGITARVHGTGTDTVLEVTDVDGTVTAFQVTTAPDAGVAAVFGPGSVREPGQIGTTTYSYDTAGRVTRILAPVPAGVNCGPLIANPNPANPLANLNAGCRALRIEYATSTHAPGTTGDYTGQVSGIYYDAYNPDKTGGAGMDEVQMTSYAYDDNGYLVAITDETTGLTTRYTYDANDRLKTVTPPGLEKFTLSYDSNERLSQVMRDNPTGTGTTVLGTYLYDVDTDGSNGTPDLSGSAVQQWGQPAFTAPTHGYAVFGPDKPSIPTDPANVSSGDWPYASFYYTNDRGYTTNTAAYGAGQWLYTDTEYDTNGTVVRELDNGDIANVLGDGVDKTTVGTKYVYAAVMNGSTETIPAGSVLTDVYGPARTVVLADGSTTLRRPHTHYGYDEGAPHNGVNPATGTGYGLQTSETVTAYSVSAQADVSGATLSKTLTGYDKINTSTDPDTWDLGLPTTYTVDMSTGQADLVTITRYDDQGRVIETRQPASDGTDAGTRHTIYYTAGTNSADAACENTPQWAGQVCVTTHAAAPSSGPALPDLRTTGYNLFLQPTRVKEKTGSTVLRTTRASYDTAGRVSKTWTEAVSGSESAPGASYGYDPSTGLPTSQQATDDNGATTGTSITTGYDTWGRPRTYTPATGETTTTSYNSLGQIDSVTDPQGTTSYTYDGTDTNGNVEHRGLVTGLEITGTSQPTLKFTGAYDAAGTLVTQALPGELTQTVTTDRVGQPVGMTYADTTQPWVGWSQDYDLLGRVIREWTPTGAAFDGALTSGRAAGYSRAYTYDRAGRLTSVEDHTATTGSGTVAPDDLASTVCQTRDYAFDNNGNRTSLTRTGANPDGTCATTGGTSRTWAYDTADRLTGNYAYDTLGRATTIPAADTPAGSSAGNLTLGYYNTDAVASIAQNGTTTSYTLDAAGRRSVSTSVTAGTTAETVTRHYIDGTDNPGWVETNQGGTASTTRYAGSLGGDLAATITTNGSTVAAALAVVDLHGDVVTNIAIPTSGSPDGIGAWVDTDEYGNPLTATVGTTPTSDTGVGYGWLGGKERATTDTGLLLMGARIYNPITGQFVSPDQVFGGNTTAYAYPQDPINSFDLDGYELAGLSEFRCKWPDTPTWLVGGKGQ